MATAELYFDGQQYTRNRDGRMLIVPYVVKGATDVVDAETATGLPAMGDEYLSTGMIVSSIAVAPQGLDDFHVVTVTYELLPGSTSDKPTDPAAGDEWWQMETTGQAVNKKTALAQTTYGNTARPSNNMIGVHRDGTIEGVDVQDLAARLVITKWLAPATVEANIANYFAAYSRVNSDVFFGFAAGQVLFVGIRIPNRNIKLWELEFEFLLSPNAAAGDLPTFINPDGSPFTITGGKLGWEYMTVEQVERKDDGQRELCTQGVYVNQVYVSDPGNFSGLGLSGNLF